MDLKPGNLILSLRKGAKPAPGYLLLGAEPFYRGRCHEALRDTLLGKDPDPTAVAEVDLAGRSLTALIDEAQTMSLFCSERLIIGRNAESALPRSNSRAADEQMKVLSRYFEDPVPGTVVVLEAVRFESQDRGGKDKLARIARFYKSVPVRIDLNSLSVDDARFVGNVLARRMGLKIAREDLHELVDMLGADALRIESELEKIAQYVGKGGQATRKDIELLVPEARQSGVFEFSQALAARDRSGALGILDTMSKAGMYWPMQLNLTASLFRQALAAKELGLQQAPEITSRLNELGFRMWATRSRQVSGIVARFDEQELREALIALFDADRSLRSTVPDQRLVVELLVMKLTG